jgi:nucleotide-binding universal stress UspA family protein
MPADSPSSGLVEDGRMMARPRSILVAYDGSTGSERALDAAADLVGYGSGLTVVYVPREGRSANGVVDDARARLLRRHLVARYLERPGEPAEEIVEAARASAADLIVVGRPSELGSVSRAVLEHAPCDVLVVR